MSDKHTGNCSQDCIVRTVKEHARHINGQRYSSSLKSCLMAESELQNMNRILVGMKIKPGFRCTSNQSCTTQHWIGSNCLVNSSFFENTVMCPCCLACKLLQLSRRTRKVIDSAGLFYPSRPGSQSLNNTSFSFIYQA